MSQVMKRTFIAPAVLSAAPFLNGPRAVSVAVMPRLMSAALALIPQSAEGLVVTAPPVSQALSLVPAVVSVMPVRPEQDLDLSRQLMICLAPVVGPVPVSVHQNALLLALSRALPCPRGHRSAMRTSAPWLVVQELPHRSNHDPRLISQVLKPEALTRITAPVSTTDYSGAAVALSLPLPAGVVDQRLCSAL